MENLPAEMLCEIVSHLDYPSTVRLAQCSREMLSVVGKYIVYQDIGDELIILANLHQNWDKFIWWRFLRGFDISDILGFASDELLDDIELMDIEIKKSRLIRNKPIFISNTITPHRYERILRMHTGYQLFRYDEIVYSYLHNSEMLEYFKNTKMVPHQSDRLSHTLCKINRTDVFAYIMEMTKSLERRSRLLYFVMPRVNLIKFAIESDYISQESGNYMTKFIKIYEVPACYDSIMVLINAELLTRIESCAVIEGILTLHPELLCSLYDRRIVLLKLLITSGARHMVVNLADRYGRFKNKEKIATVNNLSGRALVEFAQKLPEMHHSDFAKYINMYAGKKVKRYVLRKLKI